MYRLLALSSMVLAVTAFPISGLVAEVGEFDIRTVIPMTPEQMAALRTIAAEDPEAAAVVQAVVAAAEPLVDAEPRPLAVIHYEGLVNTDPKRIATVDHLRELDDVAALTRYFQATGDERAATALIRFIEAWATTYHPTGNDVNENKFVPLFIAYLMLRNDLDPARRSVIDTWVDTMAPLHVTAIRRSTHLNNRYTKHLRLVALFGLILDRPEYLDLAREGVRRFVSESLRGDGASLDFEQRDTLTYHCSSLKPPIELAMLLGEPALYDWENANQGSLRKSVDFVIPYATGEQIHREWVDSTVELDRKRAEAGLEKYRVGRLFDPQDSRELFEYAHFFDPDLLPIFLELDGSETQRIPSWRLLVHAAVHRAQAGSATGR